MILDSSVIVLILLRQEGWEEWLEVIANSRHLACGAPTLVEASVILASRVEHGSTALRAFTEELGVDVVPFERAHWNEAVRAHAKYGRGRHPARLNFGDCMSYAVAKIAGLPLAYVGDDFSQTDLAVH